MSMFKRVVVAAGLFVMAGSPAFAQGRVEVSVFGGWTFSDGVSLDGHDLGGRWQPV